MYINRLLSDLIDLSGFGMKNKLEALKIELESFERLPVMAKVVVVPTLVRGLFVLLGMIIDEIEDLKKNG